MELVAAERVGVWSPTVLATTTFAGFDGNGDVDVRLHASGPRVWIDWEQDAGGLGWVSLQPNGQWSSARYEPVADMTDEEAGRLRIARQVLR